MNEVLVYGNPESGGLASEISKQLGATCIGRQSHGLDMINTTHRHEFIEKSFAHNIVILCVYAPKFAQVLLLEELYRAWTSLNKGGRIIVIGSSCDRYSLSQPQTEEWLTYPVEKLALREQVRIINATTYQQKKQIFACYISPHHMNTAKYSYDEALSVSQVTNALSWLLEQDYLVEEICIRQKPKVSL